MLLLWTGFTVTPGISRRKAGNGWKPGPPRIIPLPSGVWWNLLERKQSPHLLYLLRDAQSHPGGLLNSAVMAVTVRRLPPAVPLNTAIAFRRLTDLVVRVVDAKRGPPVCLCIRVKNGCPDVFCVVPSDCSSCKSKNKKKTKNQSVFWFWFWFLVLSWHNKAFIGLISVIGG